MSRTTHHVPWRHRGAEPGHAQLRKAADNTTDYRQRRLLYAQLHSLMRRDPAVTRHVITDLRYPAVEEQRAASNGRRPQPQRLAHTFAGYSYDRAPGGRWIGDHANRLERRQRAELRAWKTDVLKQLRTDRDTADDLPAPDGRTRHGAVWLAS